MAVAPVPAPVDRSWLKLTAVIPARDVARRLVVAARHRMPGVAQAIGVSAVTVGVFILAGLGVGLVVGGVLAVGLGVLFEKETG